MASKSITLTNYAKGKTFTRRIYFETAHFAVHKDFFNVRFVVTHVPTERKVAFREHTVFDDARTAYRFAQFLETLSDVVDWDSKDDRDFPPHYAEMLVRVEAYFRETQP